MGFTAKLSGKRNGAIWFLGTRLSCFQFTCKSNYLKLVREKDHKHMNPPLRMNQFAFL